ncbi:MAG: acyl-CoA dehydratase activase [Candidatus Helarchaeota archaeon]
MYFAGVDVGSLAGKVVILKWEDGNKPEIVGKSITVSRVIPQKTARIAYQEALDNASINKDDVKYIIGTGYGRIKIPFASTNISEIACHGKGANWCIPSVRTIVDIGGQDSKVIKVDENGKLVDFGMNDKCAAGTGRFLEVMAKALETKLEDMGEIALKSKRPCTITAQCGIFAETEVISLIAEGKNVVDIIAGLHDSIASRILSLVNRVGLELDIVMTGGVAKNVGVIAALEKKLGVELKKFSIDPQLIGALGAALFAKEEYQKSISKSKRKLKKWDF